MSSRRYKKALFYFESIAHFYFVKNIIGISLIRAIIFLFQIQIKDIKTFPVSFWLVSVVCVAYYVAIFPFISLSKPFFKRKDGFGFDDSQAAILQSKSISGGFLYMIVYIYIYIYN